MALKKESNPQRIPATNTDAAARGFTLQTISHVVMLRTENPELGDPSVWVGIAQSDNESESHVIMCTSLGGRRRSEISLNREEWGRLRSAIVRGDL